MHSKQRTREHVIADLSVNHVERFALRCGFAVRRIVPDYGLDLEVITFDERGYREDGQVWMQVKATDNVKKSRDGKTASIRIERRDVLAWIKEAYPAIFVLYDAAGDLAYYLPIKEHFGGHDIFERLSGATVTVQIPTENKMSEMAMHEFARTKKAMLPK